MISRSVAAGSSNRVGSSPSAMTGKSSRGRVDRLKRERPATICILPSAAVSSTWLPSGSLRTISNKVWAETVVAPACSTLAATLSSTCRSRSVAISRSEPSSLASSSTLDRIGMVLRRSTTDWTWPSPFNNVARSIVAFMCQLPHLPTCIAHACRHRYSEPDGLRKWGRGDSGGKPGGVGCDRAGSPQCHPVRSSSPRDASSSSARQDGAPLQFGEHGTRRCGLQRALDRATDGCAQAHEKPPRSSPGG